MPGAKRAIKIKLHPLFLVVGVLSALTGQLLVFLAACLAALEHELAHAFAARRYGYTLDKIVLMPYGAIISGDLTGIGRKRELAVLVAGPLANGATAFFFVALWWLWPVTYPYTDAAAIVSFSLFAVNLLPAWPLDGGRILHLLLRPLGQKKSRIVCLVVSLAVAAGVLAYFVWSCFSSPAFTALAFAVLLAVGAFGGGSYRPVDYSGRDFSKGLEERRVAISADRPLSEVLRFLREDKYLVLILFEAGEYLGELPEEELVKRLKAGDYSRSLKSCMDLL